MDMVMRLVGMEVKVIPRLEGRRESIFKKRLWSRDSIMMTKKETPFDRF